MDWVWIVQLTDVVKCKEIMSSLITLQVENSNKNVQLQPKEGVF